MTNRFRLNDFKELIRPACQSMWYKQRTVVSEVSRKTNLEFSAANDLFRVME